MNEINLIHQQFNSTVSAIYTDINNLQNTTTTLQSEINNLEGFYNSTLQSIQQTNQNQDQQISQLQQKDINSTPQQITITPINPNVQNPNIGITNTYNSGGYISFSGSSDWSFDNKNVAGRKLVIDFMGTPPLAADTSLFEITYILTTATNFYRTCFMLHVYPNRLWNNQAFVTKWDVIGNEISGNDNYELNDPTYAPNGRFYWSFNQTYTNFGSSGLKNAWIVPQQDRINIIFGLPQLFNPITGQSQPFVYDIYARCLNNYTVTVNGGSCNLRDNWVDDGIIYL